MFQVIQAMENYTSISALALLLMAGPLHAEYILANGERVVPLQLFKECNACPEMIVLPLGEFTMGGPPGESRANLVLIDGELTRVPFDHPAVGAEERPLHSVVIDIPIAIGRNEVTYNEWMACVADGGCGGHVPRSTVLITDENGVTDEVEFQDDHPVVDVSYLDAQKYIEWLNDEAETDEYRLPTEAEWEYAARAGTQTTFAQGDDATDDQINVLGGPGKPVPVDSMEASNGWGIRHMSGNVAEQTRSCYTTRHLGWQTSSQHLIGSRVASCRRVIRGGAYAAAKTFARPGARGGSAAEDTRSTLSGFRVVRELNNLTQAD